MKFAFFVFSSLLTVSASAQFAQGPGAPQGGQRPSPAEMMMKHADTNADGKISEEEFLVRPREQFKKMDANADGFVTADEAKAFGEQMRKKMEQRRQHMQQYGSGNPAGFRGQ